MDVLSPDLLWIDDRCYRIPVLNSPTENYVKHGTDNFVEAEPVFDVGENNSEIEDDDTSDVENLIEALPNNRYKLGLAIPQIFWPKIIGAKGVTKKRIEVDTDTMLIIPRPMEHGDIVIKGASKRNLIVAKKKIDSIVFSSRQKLVFTHFVSIPMNCNEIKTNFLTFKDQVLKSFGKDRGIDESIFQNPDKLHLTIGTLVLTDQKERDLAEKLLHKVFENSIQPILTTNKDILLEMKGIEYMNDDPAEVDVLYAKITSGENHDIIQRITQNILQYFSHHKLLKSNEKEEIKLHVTLMNTLFREEEPDEMDVEVENVGTKHKWNRKRRTFNAVNVLQNFQNFYFGQQELKNIQLSIRFSTAKNGYYKSSCTLNI